MNVDIFLSSDRYAAYFDEHAAHYDDVWTNSPAGRAQRSAVWRQLDALVRPGDRVLDLGCGTGEDALHLAALGADVVAIDASPEMVRIARSRGVNARVLPMEGVRMLPGAFDLVLSDFGACNCIRDLAALRETLLRLVRPNGSLALCLMNRFCLVEFLHFALRGNWRKATRRWGGEAITSAGLQVFYPTSKQVRKALMPGFRFTAGVGIGISVPFLSRTRPLANQWSSLDARLGASRIGGVIGDHRLYFFRRSS